MRLSSKLFLFVVFLLSCENNEYRNQITKPNSWVTVNVKVFRISDIRFSDQQYSIDFQLYMDYRDTSFDFSQIDFLNKLQFPDSKNIRNRSLVYSNYDTNGEKNIVLEFSCVLAQSYDVIGYPFDDQKLVVEINYPFLDTSKLNFITDTKKILYLAKNKIESGWKSNANLSSIYVQKKAFSDDTLHDTHSVFYFEIPIHRKWAIFIFSKLFIGMYIAFLVSFVALFINVEYDEPRFGLPVGGLFATIANKYIIEGSLPLTPDFSLVDWLHTITITAIFLIIAISAISLKLKDMRKNAEISIPDTKLYLFHWKISGQWKKRWMDRVDRVDPYIFLLFYILVNILICVILAHHNSLWF